MTIKFKKISEARAYLAETGFAWAGFSPLTSRETYASGPLTAMIKKVPFAAGYEVRIA